MPNRTLTKVVQPYSSLQKLWCDRLYGYLKTKKDRKQMNWHNPLCRLSVICLTTFKNNQDVYCGLSNWVRWHASVRRTNKALPLPGHYQIHPRGGDMIDVPRKLWSCRRTNISWACIWTDQDFPWLLWTLPFATEQLHGRFSMIVFKVLKSMLYLWY